MIASLRTRVLRHLPESRLIRGVALLAGGNALAQAIGIAAWPILTRLYTPEDLGLLGVYGSLLGLGTIVAGGRYELAIPLPKRDRGALNVLVLTLATVLASAMVLAAALWLFGDRLLDWTNSRPLGPYLWLVPIAVVGGGFYQAFNYWATRRKNYRRLAQTRLNQSLSSAATGIGIGAFHPGPLGLLLAAILAQTAGISTLAGDAWREARALRFRISWKRLRHAAYTYRQFPRYAALAGLCNSAGLLLPALLLAAFYGPEVTGWFGLAQRLMMLPLGLVGAAVAQVFLGEAAHLVRESPERLPSFFNRVTLRLLPLCGLVALLGGLSPFLFGFIFGKNYAPAGWYAAMLAVSASAQLLVSPISMVAILLKRQDVQLGMDVVRVAAVVAVLCIPPMLHASGTLTVAVYALAMAALYCMYFFTYRRLTFGLAEKKTTSGRSD